MGLPWRRSFFSSLFFTIIIDNILVKTGNAANLLI